MTDHERLLATAREAWRSAAPSEQEIRRGAERVERRLGARPRSLLRRPVMISAGACAAFLAALAYAGNQKWVEVSRPPTGDPQKTVTPAPTPLVDRPSLSEPASTLASSPSPIDANEIPPVVPEARSQPTAQSAAPPPALPVEKKGALARKPAPSWSEVSEALSGGDEEHAQKLLSDLASNGHDADDRAKAKLGLAQLEASHGNCARARVLALQVAAVQGIELKTVRRALELATHCTQ
jgi:hypothetical protein